MIQLTLLNRMESNLGKRYERRVWAKYDRSSYLLEQAYQGAAFADQIRGNLLMDLAPSDSTYYLANPHGKRYCALGIIHFRYPSIFPSFINLTSHRERYEKVAEIERIRLHPSIRHQGLLRLLGASLKSIGFRALICKNVYNPGLACHWMQQASVQSNGIYVAPGYSIDFDRTLNSGPTFIMDLDRWAAAHPIVC